MIQADFPLLIIYCHLDKSIQSDRTNTYCRW